MAIAVAALAHIAADPAHIERFAALTGIAPTEMRQASRSPGFFLAVLDYLGGHEPDLLAFATAQGLDPARVAAARDVLENEEADGGIEA